MMSRKSRQQLLETMRWHYARASDRVGKGRLLEGFCAATGHERKYAIKLLGGRRRLSSNGAGAGKKRGGSQPKYGSREVAVLKGIWFLAEQPCGKRLKAMLPLWLPAWERRHGALEILSRQRVLSISPAQIDRLLGAFKVGSGARGPRPAQSVRSQVPLRTGPWAVSVPGWFEADTVAHCGVTTRGCFAWSLVLTDIHSGWTEVRATWNRSDRVIHQRVQEIEASLPFEIVGFDSDNGGEFINATLLRYFRHREKPVEVTRSRPYRKNDQAHVEQKNLTHVRQFLSYERFDFMELVEPLNALLMRWSRWQNFYSPSLKLLKKERSGTRLIRRHEKNPRTPAQRLLENDAVSDSAKAQLTQQLCQHDPIELKEQIECGLKTFWKLYERLVAAAAERTATGLTKIQKSKRKTA